MGIFDSPGSRRRYVVPTYYITDTLQEDAGDGNARIWNCERVNGVVVPRCEIIMHASKLIIAGRLVAKFAETLSIIDHRIQSGAKVH